MVPESSQGYCADTTEMHVKDVAIPAIKHIPGEKKGIKMFNQYLVGVSGSGISVMRPPKEMTEEEALEFAAWIVCLAGGREKFLPVLDELENS